MDMANQEAETLGKMVWDPVEGSVPFKQDEIADPGTGIKVPGAIKTFFGVLALLSFPTLLIGLFYRDALWAAAGMVVVSVAGMIGIDMLSKGSASDAWRMFQLARRNGWAFHSVAQEVRSTRKNSSKAMSQRDPLFARIADQVPELIRARPGQLIPMTSNGIFWGVTSTAIPFLMSVGRYDVDATFAVAEIKKDRFGNIGQRGTQYGILMAYGLERDTRIRAAMLGEAMDRDSWRDFKTESSEFNNRFKIFIDGEGGADSKLALLQALTPATQAALIDFADRHNVQVILDRTTLWIAGFDRVMNEEPEALSRHFSAIVEDFAAAATAFKHYLE